MNFDYICNVLHDIAQANGLPYFSYISLKGRGQTGRPGHFAIIMIKLFGHQPDFLNILNPRQISILTCDFLIDEINHVLVFSMKHNLSNSACQRFFQGFFKDIFQKISRSGYFCLLLPLQTRNFPSKKVLLEIGLKRYYFAKRERKMTPEQIGKLIRDTRKIQGLRQDELAAAAGVFWLNWKPARRPPSLAKR